MIGATDEVVISTPGAIVVDSEGRTSNVPTTETVQGRVDELTTRDVEVAAQVGQTHDVVVKVDLGTNVTDRASVVVTTPEREHLSGTYKIDSIRTTRRGLRLLCSRTTISE
jgi:hypothetical protein